MLVLPAITRLLGPAEYGVVALSIVVIQVLVTFAAAGIPAAISRFYFGDDSGPHLSRVLMGQVLFIAVVLALLADVTGSLWSRLFNELIYDAALRIAAWTVVPLAMTQASQASLRAQDRPGAFVTVTAMSTLGAQGLGLLSLLLFEPSPAAYLGGFAAGVASSAAVGVLLVTPMFDLRNRQRLLKRALRYGAPTIPHVLALFLLTAGDRIVIERLLGIDAVGRYTVAYMIGGTCIGLVAAFNNAWAPMIYGVESDKRWNVLAESTSIVSRITSLLIVLLALAAPLALAVIAPTSYLRFELSPLVAGVALSALPYVWYTAAVHVVFYYGETRIVAWLTPAAAVLNLLLNFALIPILSLMGAVIATVVSYTVLALGMHWRARALQPVEWPLREAGVTAVLTLGVVGAAALVPTDGPGIWLRVTASGIVVAMALRVVRSL